MARIGRARVGVTPPWGMGMAGFGLLGRPGRVSVLPAQQRLWMGALSLRDDGGRHVVIATLELWSGTAWLERAVRADLAARGIEPDLLLLAGCHTHAGPGRYAGNCLYDLATTKVPFRWPRWSRQLARAVADAVAGAVADERDGARLGLVVARWSDAGRNRAPKAALASGQGEVPAWWTAPGGPGHGAPPGADVKQQLVDRRLPVLVATDAQGGLLATVALAGVHATALGPVQDVYSADWPGSAARHVADALAERWVDGPHVGVGIPAAGDVGPLPSVEPPGGWRTAQGPALVTQVALEVARPWVEAVEAALDGGLPDTFTLDPRPSTWTPPARTPPFCIGKGVIKGPIDPRKAGNGAVVCYTGNHFPAGHPQHPKVPALGPLQPLLRGVGVRPEPAHPMHLLRIALPVRGAHAPEGLVLVTLPGEITVHAGWRLEGAVRSALAERGETVTTAILGYTNDYFGYVTTPEEYAVQEYEGAHTIYGSDQLALLTDHVLGRL